MRFGPYLQPVETEVYRALPDVTQLPELHPESPFELFNDSLRKLEKLQLQDLEEQRKRISSQIAKTSLHAEEQVSKSIRFLNNQLSADLESMKADYEQHVERERKAKEAEETRKREIERLRKVEEEKQRAIHEEKRREKQKAEEFAKKKAEDEERKRAEEAKLAEEKAKKAAEEEKERAEKERHVLEKEKAEKDRKGLTLQARIQRSLLFHLDNIKRIKNEVVAPVDNDKPLKKELNAIKRKINVKLGQLSISQRQVESVSRELHSLVNIVPSRSLQYHWLLNFLAKALVSQAEMEVTVKPTAAVPLGYIAAMLLKAYPEFEEYLLARLVKKCCFVIGYTGTIDSVEGRLRMGWKRTSDDKWESEVKYEERVAGIFTVWAVMTRFINIPHHPLYSWEAHWTCLARILNTSKDLFSNVHYVVMNSWWEASAEGLYSTYGKQSVKLLRLISQDWANFGVSKKFGAATRLQTLGEDVISKNKFNTLKHMDP